MTAATKSKSAARDTYKSKVAGLEILGEVIAWTAGSQSVKYADVVSALTSAGLDPKELASELSARNAFNRAKARLQEERTIDVVKEDVDYVVFQFTKKVMDTVAQEWQYSTETFLELNKVTGEVKCKVKELQKLAKELLDKAMEDRTAGDITRVAQKAFDMNAQSCPCGLMIPIKGGCYIILKEALPFTDQVEKFLAGVGGTMSRFPIPAGTSRGDKNVQVAVASELQGMIAAFEEKVNAFDADTRADTLTRKAQEISDMRTRIKAHAHYLGKKTKELLEAAEEGDKLLTAKVAAIQAERDKLPPKKREGSNGTTKPRHTVLDYSMNSSIRWMSQQGWSVDEIRAVLKEYGVPCPDDKNMSYQCKLGRNGEAGIAGFDAEQAKELEKARKRAKSHP